MSTIPSPLKYTKTHEWIRLDSDNTVTVGITDHAQDLLGELVYIELPEVGRIVQQGEEIAVVESVKAASDVYAPLSGEVLEVNAELKAHPDHVNESSYEQGWLFKLKLSNGAQLSGLLDAAAYNSLVEAEG